MLLNTRERRRRSSSSSSSSSSSNNSNQNNKSSRFGALGYYEPPESAAALGPTSIGGAPPRTMRRPQSASQLGRKSRGAHSALTPPRVDLTATTRGPAVVNMSASLATRWQKHLKSTGLDQASGRKAVAAKHVQRVRHATSQRSLTGSGSANSSTTASRRPFSAGMNGRPTSVNAAALTIQAVTDSAASKQRRVQHAQAKKKKSEQQHRRRRPRPKSANPRGRSRSGRSFAPPEMADQPLSPFERFGSGSDSGRGSDGGGGGGGGASGSGSDPAHPMGAGIRDFIDNVRSLRRSNIIEHTTSRTQSDLRDLIERELRDQHMQQVYGLRTRLAAAERNLVDMTDRYEDANRRLTSAMDERSSLAFNVPMVSCCCCCCVLLLLLSSFLSGSRLVGFVPVVGCVAPVVWLEQFLLFSF
jgi:hypothetical protein